MKASRSHFQITYVSLAGAMVLLYLVFSPLFHLGFHLLFGFQSFGSITYLGQAMTQKQKTELRSTHTKALAKVERFWGVPQAQPQLVICVNEGQFRSICRQAEGAGCSLGTPMGSWVVLLEQDTDVLAHELAHSEMIHRWGYWTTRLKIPTWLEEGIALQVDDRFVHAADSVSRYEDFDMEWQVMTFGGRYSPQLADISRARDFFRGSETEVRLAYLTAGRQVSQWWASNGRQAIWDVANTYRQRTWWEVMTNGTTVDAKLLAPKQQ